MRDLWHHDEMDLALANIVDEMEGEPAEALGIVFQLRAEEFPGDHLEH